jgi:hypothetical protein
MTFGRWMLLLGDLRASYGDDKRFNELPLGVFDSARKRSEGERANGNGVQECTPEGGLRDRHPSAARRPSLRKPLA